MSEKNYDIYLDLGSSKIRVTAFDKQEKNQIFFLEKNCLTCLKLNVFLKHLEIRNRLRLVYTELRD